MFNANVRNGDRQLTAEDIQHFKANQARSYGAHMAAAKLGEGAKLVIKGKRVR